jgi:HD-like signal output (HDOD) protein
MSLTKVDHAEVRKRLQKKENIPTLPTTFTELVRATSDPNTSLTELATLIAYDPTLMASVLRVANSSFMGLKEPVNELSTAVLYLGMSEIRRAALAVGSFDLFTGKGYTASYLKDIWVHSLATGLISQNIASIAQFDFSEEAYIAGLLHDFGKLFFATSYSKEYADLRAQVVLKKEETLNLETQTLGLNHLQVIEDIGKEWKLPTKILQVAIHHHDPLQADEQFQLISLCVATSNILAHHMINDEPVEHRMPQAQMWLAQIAAKAKHPEQLTFQEIGSVLTEEAEELRCYEEVTSKPL